MISNFLPINGITFFNYTLSLKTMNTKKALFTFTFEPAPRCGGTKRRKQAKPPGYDGFRARFARTDTQ